MLEAADIGREAQWEDRIFHVAKKARENGWDDEFGGILHFSGVNGGEPLGDLTGVEEVTVQIKFTGLTTKTFNVTRISAVNVPTGLRQEIITKALSVTVRGTETSINAIKGEDLSVEVDLSEAQVGTASMTAKVIVAESFPGVGAVGTYQVSVTLREQ